MKKILLLSLAFLFITGRCNAQVKPPPHAASTKTWTFGSKTWSDAIRIPACDKASFTDSEDTPDCRSYAIGGETGYYYNWAYVDAKKRSMCPVPWRVPSADDAGFWRKDMLREMGILWAGTGYISQRVFIARTGWGFYWTDIDSKHPALSFYMYDRNDTKTYRKQAVALMHTDGLNNAAVWRKSDGLQVRCVRRTQ
jgi:hypothetical protein